MQPFIRRIEELEEHFGAVDYCSCPSNVTVAARASVWALLVPGEPMPEQLPIICSHRRHRPRPEDTKLPTLGHEALFTKLLGDYIPLESQICSTGEDEIRAQEAKPGMAVDEPIPEPAPEAVPSPLEQKIAKTWSEHKELKGITDDRLPTEV